MEWSKQVPRPRLLHSGMTLGNRKFHVYGSARVWMAHEPTHGTTRYVFDDKASAMAAVMHAAKHNERLRNI